MEGKQGADFFREFLQGKAKALSENVEQRIREFGLSPNVGESHVIVLGLELQSLILLDDKKARRVAKELGLRITGTLGVLIEAKQSGLITEVKPLLDKLYAEGFYGSADLYIQALKLANEK